MIEGRIRAAGLRATRPRTSVLAVLGEVGGHRSVDEIVGFLHARGVRLPRTSVYNVVEDLRRAGLVMGADAGPGRALYEVADRWHHHFVCRGCGVVVDVPCVVGARPCLAPDFVDGQVDEAAIIFRGWCTACAPADGPGGG